MKTKTLLILVAFVILVLACQPIPISGDWEFYYFWKYTECPVGEFCISETKHTTCQFAGDRFTCGADGELGGQVEFDGTVLTMRFDQGSTNIYFGEFRDDGTVSGVMSNTDMSRIGTWWMEQK